MRVVEVNGYYFPYHGGIEQRINEISKRLARRHEVTIVTSRLPGTSAEEDIDGCRVIRLDSKFVKIYNPPYVDTPGLMRRLNELKPDVVDFHYRWGLTYADAVRRYDGKKVFTYHNTFGEGAGPSRAFSILNDELFMRSLRFCDRIVCVSEFVMRDLSGRGINPAKIVAVPNGVELADHADDGEDDFILFVGRLVSTKGLVYLIKAMRQIETKLIVCGEGPELGRLKRLVARYALNERVTFAGRVSSELRDKLMSTCKVFVMPSVFESYGIAVAEAMSHGRPIVACRVGGLPDVVQDAGFLVPPKDANALAAGVNRLLSDAGKRRELGHRAQQLSRDYSWEKAAEDMERIYSVIAGVG